MHKVLVYITDIGDSGVLMAVVLAGAAYLLRCGHRRDAAALGVAFLAAVLGIALVKLLFLSCKADFPGAIHSPSGHAALSAAVFGIITLLSTRKIAGWRRFIVFISVVGIVGLIGLSRIRLGFHSMVEVIIGLMIGTCAVLLTYLCLLRGRDLPPINTGRLALWIFAAGILLYGFRLPVEPMIQWLALHIRGYNPLC